MADAAAARREARRRKILENSQNRLQIISGKSTCEVNHAVPVIPVPTEEIDDFPSTRGNSLSTVSSYNNGVVVTDEEPTGFPPRNPIDESGDNEVVSDFLAPLLTQLPQAVEERPADRHLSSPLWERIIASKYDVVILSFLLQLLYSTVSVSSEDVLFFLPLAIYATMKSMLFPSKSNTNFANILVLLHGLSTTRVQRLIQIAQVVSVFSQDVCIFLFTTICMQAILVTISSVLM